ncbi:alpha/beta hydrolase [Fulvivirgaceae bacterium PWU20]|uniref:Alpha/beta hydrolase n=2 Tax=Chryseosolibacter indicus TaxID=2782351 RepID=A0ABS5VRC9_9BACT|nr:alpha/beta hydrolase [Chryseosolibacter indicus]
MTIPSRAQQKINLHPNKNLRVGGVNKIAEAPYMEYFSPAKGATARDVTILICPGGAYTALADQHEGIDVAKYYNSFGFHAFVLRYRLNVSDQSGARFPDQYNDVTTAIRIIKSRAQQWNINPEKVGILGFSAGGHLASMATTMHLKENKDAKDILEQFNSRPAFSILVYPVITLSDPFAHQYSREMLLGKNPEPLMIDSLSTQNRVDKQTPPVFLIHSRDDKAVPLDNSLLFHEALRKFDIPAELHIYNHGGHGYGMAPKDEMLNTWPLLTVKWLEQLGYKASK